MHPPPGEASLNFGLSDQLKNEFPNIASIARPLVQNQVIQNAQWLVGFTSAEGCFLVSISNSSSSRLGLKVYLNFRLTQHTKDEELMTTLIKFFGCGQYIKRGSIGEFQITKLSDLVDTLIPFFKKHPIIGVKSNDFKDFCKVAELMQNKEHLTTEGLNQIRLIKAGMNSGRM